jgi:holliday junction DNA helicase RuvA
MITHVHGILAAKGPSQAVVEAGGVGYGLEIPFSTFGVLPEVGGEVKLLTHYHVREDAHKLFGFATEGERELFRQLISVSQIGPKVALNILSKVSVQDLVEIVATGDLGRLKGVPGIGPKIAERLVVELKGKLKGVEAVPATKGAPRAAGTTRQGELRRDCYDALLALGYTDTQVIRALERVAGVVGADAPLEDWIRKALQVL